MGHHVLLPWPSEKIETMISYRILIVGMWPKFYCAAVKEFNFSCYNFGTMLITLHIPIKAVQFKFINSSPAYAVGFITQPLQSYGTRSYT